MTVSPTFDVQIECGARIKRIRKQKKLTQKCLAEAIGLASQPEVSDLERGERAPSYETLRNLCLYFRVKPEYFLCLDYNLEDPEW